MHANHHHHRGGRVHVFLLLIVYHLVTCQAFNLPIISSQQSRSLYRRGSLETMVDQQGGFPRSYLLYASNDDGSEDDAGKQIVVCVVVDR